tara:strand:+ start:2384 stop:3613 length:1230 start_codon:yes stop_codon:yes gene_type:complete
MTNECHINKTLEATPQDFDIVISGGGLSGCLMASSLSDLRNTDGKLLSIAIIETVGISQGYSLSFDDRVLALSHGTASYFAQLGVWDFLQEVAQPIEKIHISDRSHYGKARLEAKNHQVSALGYVAEMSLIGQALLQVLLVKKNITWFTPDSIENINWQQSHVDIELNSGTLLTTKLLVGCDGVNSSCRTFANIESNQTSYEQSALIANVSTNISHQNVAYERFTETGPIAMLPLSKNRCSLVWTLTPALAEQMLLLDDNAFKVALEKAFGSWLGAITKVGKRDVYPLNLVQAKTQIYHRMALVGNASHTIHPIAGQGFNLGVRDVQQLSQLIKTAQKKGGDIGDFALLNQYQQQRSNDHKQVITLTDSLVTLFSNQLPPLVIGRSVGLKVLNYLSPLKKVLVKKTMGY